MTKQTDLRTVPDPKSKSLGQLPPGSIVTMVGEQRGLYGLVEVELEDSKILQGWVALDRLDVMGPQKSQFTNQKDAKKEAPKAKNDLILPRDELLTLRREPSFLYGAQLGGIYSFIQNDVDANSHQGWGLAAGGFAGMFLTPQVPLRFEVNYVQYNGVSPDDNLVFGFGFLEMGLIPSFLLPPFEFFAGVQYNYGLSLQDLPTPIATSLQAPSDLSGIWFQMGASYRFQLSQVFQLGVRLRYSISFNASPFLFHGIGGTVFMEFQG